MSEQLTPQADLTPADHITPASREALYGYIDATYPILLIKPKGIDRLGLSIGVLGAGAAVYGGGDLVANYVNNLNRSPDDFRQHSADEFGDTIDGIGQLLVSNPDQVSICRQYNDVGDCKRFEMYEVTTQDGVRRLVVDTLEISSLDNGKQQTLVDAVPAAEGARTDQSDQAVLSSLGAAAEAYTAQVPDRPDLIANESSLPLLSGGVTLAVLAGLAKFGLKKRLARQQSRAYDADIHLTTTQIHLIIGGGHTAIPAGQSLRESIAGITRTPSDGKYIEKGGKAERDRALQRARSAINSSYRYTQEIRSRVS